MPCEPSMYPNLEDWAKRSSDGVEDIAHLLAQSNSMMMDIELSKVSFWRRIWNRILYALGF